MRERRSYCVAQSLAAALSHSGSTTEVVEAARVKKPDKLIAYHRAVADGVNPDEPEGLKAWVKL